MDIIGMEVIKSNPTLRVGSTASRIANIPSVARIAKVPKITVAPPGKLQLTYGDTMRLTVKFDYKGPGMRLTFYGSIGNQGIFGFDEIISTERAFDIAASLENFSSRTAYVDIAINSSIAAKPNYDLMAKIKEYPSTENRVENVIDITGVAPTFELIHEETYPFAWIYDGDIERVKAEYRTDPFTPSNWNGKNFAKKLREEILAEGGHILSIKVYSDVTPLLWTDFRIEAEYVPAGGTSTEGRIEGWPALAPIIAIALAAIGIIVAITIAFVVISDKFKHKPDLESAKQGWSKETLISCIQESEEYWERPITDREQLEAMSEEDVREYLDDIAEAEIPPSITWWPLLVGGGIAAVGIGYGLLQRKGKKADEKK